MTFVPNREFIGLSDILPDGFNDIDAARVLRLDDLIFPNDNHEIVPGDDISYEYRFCLPINIAKVIENQVTGLTVRIRNVSGGAGPSIFRFDINFFDDLYGKQDVGEQDFEELRQLVTRERVIFREYGIESPFRHPSNQEFTTNALARPSNMSPHELLSIIGSTIGTRTLEDVIGESIESGFTVPALRAAGYGNDPNLNEPITVTDNTNIMGTSLSSLRQKLREENQLIRGFNTFHGAIVSTLEAHEDDRPENIALGTYQRYHSPVFLSKRRIRIAKRKVNPQRQLVMTVKPIMANPRGVGTSVSVFNSFNLEEQLRTLTRSTHPPKVRIVSECKGYAKILLTKTDPTCQNVSVECHSVNPHTGETIRSEPVSVVMDEMQKVVEIRDIHNVYPMETLIHVYVLQNPDNVVVSTTSIQLPMYHNSVPYLMPEHVADRDDITLTAVSQKNSVLIRIANLPNGFLYGHLMREDLSIPAQRRAQKHVVASVGTNRENQAGDFEVTDSNVANNRLYRYFLEYKVALPIMFSLIGSPGKGQERKNYEKRTSTRDATVKFRRSLTDHVITLDTPTFKNSLPGGPRGVKIRMGIEGAPGDITFRKIKEILGSDRVDARSDFGRDQAAMRTKINIALVERIDRVTGDEAFVGAAVLQPNVVTQFVDGSFFRQKNSNLSDGGLGGKYTYKVKLCRPIVGALQKLKIPLKEPRFNGSPLQARQTEIDALKLTSEIFTKTGILTDSETLSNGSYLDIIKSFDTGGRFYVDFDPPQVKPSGEIVSARVNKDNRGCTLLWDVSQVQTFGISTFLIYVSINSGPKRLLGARRCVGGRTRYSYRYEPLGGMLFLNAPIFYILPIDSDGNPLGEVVAQLPSIIGAANSSNNTTSIEEAATQNPLIFREASDSFINARGSNDKGKGKNVFEDVNQKLVRKFSDK